MYGDMVCHNCHEVVGQAEPHYESARFFFHPGCQPDDTVLVGGYCTCCGSGSHLRSSCPELRFRLGRI